MAPSKHACSGCSEIIKENASSILCCQCKSWFHSKCSEMDYKEFKKVAVEIKKNKSLWTCVSCKSEVSVVVSDDIQDSNDDELTVAKIELVFNKYFTPFKANIEKTLSAIKSQLAIISQQNVDISKHCAQLDKRVSDIETKLVTFDCGPNIDGTTAKDIIAEANERKKREKNVIIYNVPESSKQVGSERLRDDREFLSKVFPSESADTLSDVKLRMIGRQSDGKPRPLLVNTSSVTVARCLLDAKAVGTGSEKILIKPDLTWEQKKHLKNLRSELNDLIKSGDTSKTIKYVNGIPRIVKVSAFRFPKEKRTFQTGTSSVLSEHKEAQN